MHLHLPNPFHSPPYFGITSLFRWESIIRHWMRGKERTLLSLGLCTAPKFYNVKNFTMLGHLLNVGPYVCVWPLVREMAAVRLASFYLTAPTERKFIAMLRISDLVPDADGNDYTLSRTSATGTYWTAPRSVLSAMLIVTMRHDSRGAIQCSNLFAPHAWNLRV